MNETEEHTAEETVGVPTKEAQQRVYKEVTSESWEPQEIGDSVEGEYLTKEENIGEYNSNLYQFKGDDDIVFSVWGSKILDLRMALCKPGEHLKITYLGTKPTGKANETKQWKVEKVQ